jgi:hypothetical protein
MSKPKKQVSFWDENDQLWQPPNRWLVVHLGHGEESDIEVEFNDLDKAMSEIRCCVEHGSYGYPPLPQR